MLFSPSFKRLSSAIFIVGVLLFSSAKTAWADPHAVFYTATGQQQLFFNTLAALDQADYVETPEDRAKLLEQRGTKESDPELVKTESKQAALLSRGVTLEGQDLWSAYKKFQLSLESVRRQESAKFINVLCEHSLGLENCDDKEKTKVNEALQDKAFRDEPANPTTNINVAGNRVLESGTSAYTQDRLNVLTDPKAVDKFRPYDPALAQLRKNVSSDANKSALIESLVSTVQHGDVVGGVETDLLEGLSVSPTGEVTVPPDMPNQAFFNKLTAMTSLPLKLLQTKGAAEARQAVVESSKNQGGILADTFAKPTTTGGEIGEVSEVLVLPPIARAQEWSSLSSIMTGGTLSKYYVDSQENVPGDVKLDRDQQGGVLGARSDVSTSTTQTGTVLGTNTGQSGEEIDLSRDPVSPLPFAVNPSSFVVDVAEGLVQAWDDKDSTDGCGPTCDFEEVVDEYSQNITNDL